MPAVAEAETSSPAPSSLSHPDAVGGASFSEQLADLEATAAAANERARSARDGLERHGGDTAREIAADLIEYRDNIEARKPSATPEVDRPARERELTDAYCEAVRQRGLVLMPVGPGTEIIVIDPALAAEYDAALAALTGANRAVRDFRSRHAADLEDERRRADADKIRSALAGDDGDAIREVLRPEVPQPRGGAFTTRDLPRRTQGG